MNHFEFGFFDELSKIAADAAGEPNANMGAPKSPVTPSARYSTIRGNMAHIKKSLEDNSMMASQLAKHLAANTTPGR